MSDLRSKPRTLCEKLPGENYSPRDASVKNSFLSRVSFVQKKAGDLLSKDVEIIVSLDLSHNGIQKVPGWIESCRDFNSLDISHNKFRIFSAGGSILNDDLIVLNLAHNDIISFPVEEGQLTELKLLILFNNPIVKDNEAMIKLAASLPNCSIAF